MHRLPIADDSLYKRSMAPLESHHSVARWHDPPRTACLLSFGAKQGTDFPRSTFWNELYPQVCVSTALQVSVRVNSLLLAVCQEWLDIGR